LDFILAISPLMTSFLGIWDTEDFSVGPTRLLISLKCGHNRWLSFLLSVGRWGSNGHDKKSEKSSIRPENISRHRKWRSEHLQLSEGKTVFSQGKPADAVFYIQNGKVKITVVSEQGKEAVVAVLGPDEFCGEGCLNGQPVAWRLRRQ
jgi:hypothetical protein